MYGCTESRYVQPPHGLPCPRTQRLWTCTESSPWRPCHDRCPAQAVSSQVRSASVHPQHNTTSRPECAAADKEDDRVDRQLEVVPAGHSRNLQRDRQLEQTVRGEDVDRGHHHEVHQWVLRDHLEKANGLSVGDAGGQPVVELADVGLQRDASQPPEDAQGEGAHRGRQVAQEDPHRDRDPRRVGVDGIVGVLVKGEHVVVPEGADGERSAEDRSADGIARRDAHAVHALHPRLQVGVRKTAEHAIHPDVAIQGGPEVPLVHVVVAGAARIRVAHQPLEG
mmetsp:Transcript_41947/g.106193  ORF Transcript_41947/g.106193 Transcript_41947/m.106193 type:complete len:280 (+) Transcript_41947:126-965(+)